MQFYDESKKTIEYGAYRVFWRFEKNQYIGSTESYRLNEEVKNAQKLTYFFVIM